jgi:hypothetical protein
LLVVFLALFFGAFSGWRELARSDLVLAKLVLAGTIAAALVVSMFDASLLLAAPSLLIWSALGAGSGIGNSKAYDEGSSSRRMAFLALFVFTCFSIARSSTQIVAMAQVGEGGLRAGWMRGAAWDPGSYRINMRVAELYANRGRCGAAKIHATRARDLFPNAAAPRRILKRCG